MVLHIKWVDRALPKPYLRVRHSQRRVGERILSVKSPRGRSQWGVLALGRYLDLLYLAMFHMHLATKPQLLRFLMLNLRPLQCWTNNLFPLDHSLTQYRGATLAIPQGLGAGSLVVWKGWSSSHGSILTKLVSPLTTWQKTSNSNKPFLWPFS